MVLKEEKNNVDERHSFISTHAKGIALRSTMTQRCLDQWTGLVWCGLRKGRRSTVKRRRRKYKPNRHSCRKTGGTGRCDLIDGLPSNIAFVEVGQRANKHKC